MSKDLKTQISVAIREKIVPLTLKAIMENIVIATGRHKNRIVIKKY